LNLLLSWLLVALTNSTDLWRFVRYPSEQIAHFKFPLDYPARARMTSAAPRIGSQSVPLFNQEELVAMINSARQLGVKVACHANDNGVISTLARFGVNSIEHGCNMTSKELELLADNKVVWNPTLAAYYSHPQAGDRWAQAQKAFKEGLSVRNLKIACGGDTGVFSHGDNSLELKLMVRLGASWERVVQAATLGGWECVRSSHWEGEDGQLRFRETHLLKEDRRTVGENEMPFGILCPGFSADIIATRGNLQTDFENAVDSSNIVFVMKAGRIYKCLT
jgi:imidazolonepropionase-like amidohydrolase